MRKKFKLKPTISTSIQILMNHHLPTETVISYRPNKGYFSINITTTTISQPLELCPGIPGHRKVKPIWISCS